MSHKDDASARLRAKKMNLQSLYLQKILALLAFLAAAPAMSEEAQQMGLRIVTFGSGPIDGAYYEAVNKVCASFNQNPIEGYRCSTDPTPGSLYNLNALKRGTLDFALVQSDLHREALETASGSYFAREPLELRSVISLYPEPFTILVRNDADISSLADLRAKRVDQGPSSSGRRPTVERVFGALGIVGSDFAELTQHALLVALEELCAGSLDAVLLVIGHPNSAVARTLKECDVHLINASGSSLRKFVADNPAFTSGTIPSHSYPELLEDISTFSVMATVMTREDVPYQLVERMAQIMIDHWEGLRKAVPDSAGMSKDFGWTAGLTAPLHAAVATVFDNQGLDPKAPVNR
ncbi:TAXI family TRAP transporter solute-binding subunit [Roseovarius gahaiensis]|uniref:TAXI family TRAP transporter solute-binding subunit n=1 Tax=Roseovarius gahaiensis TaxID=2716691 RepID=A0A967BDJ5_9RHOB|nr:TAXI family TRAP transporter solute-binding subunit [Roseovarius gahaiensis]NHQ76065.1 TAXI family TRAP transporter solute-binding subunit [Roseovarius gahaiensis]